MYPTLDDGYEMVELQAELEGDQTRAKYIEDTLESSKGQIKDSEGLLIDEYRPFLVAAITMHTSKSEQTIHEATGDAKFRYEKDRVNLRPAIEGNLRQQQALDVQQGTIVPPGWDVQTWLDSLCGCEKPGEAVGVKVHMYSGMVANCGC